VRIPKVFQLIPCFVVSEHSDDTIDMQFLVDLQDLLEHLHTHAAYLGPVLLLARFKKSNRNPSIVQRYAVYPPLDLAAAEISVGEFFSLDNNMERKFYEADLVALLLHHYFDAFEHTQGYDGTNAGDEKTKCGRCNSDRYQKPFKSCRTFLHNGLRVL
jgi:hypothetical protein